MEDGSIEYIIEIRRDVVSSRGWRLPEQPFIEFEAGNVRAFVNDFQKILRSAATAQGDILVSFESLAAEKIELLCGDGLFGKTRYEQEMRSSRLHRKIVAEVEFLLLNDDAELDWSGDKLCHALGVPRRTLYDAFKNYLGIGPQEFHRRLRLLQLRRLLIAAVAERGAITQLMGQAGFSHLGRTSVEYRKLFGETPNETLNR